MSDDRDDHIACLRCAALVRQRDRLRAALLEAARWIDVLTFGAAARAKVAALRELALAYGAIAADDGEDGA